MKKLLSLILIAVMTFAMFACGSAFAEGEGAVEEGAFNIGVYMWMSSGAATVGEEMKKAFAIAVDDMGGQVNGEDVNFLYYDTQNNPEIAVTAAQYLIGQNVDAVIGSFQSGDVVAAYPFLERGHRERVHGHLRLHRDRRPEVFLPRLLQRGLLHQLLRGHVRQRPGL